MCHLARKHAELLEWHLLRLPQGMGHLVTWMAALPRAPHGWDPTCLELGAVSSRQCLAGVQQTGARPCRPAWQVSKASMAWT